MKLSCRACGFSAAILLFSKASFAYELRPGRVRDVAGLQFFQRVAYNPVLDNYLLLYEDGRALVGHLSPAGAFSGETAISANTGVNHVNAAFNPDDGTFLVVYRDDVPKEIHGRYLTSDGTPIGKSFLIGTGGPPNIDFSPRSGRYVVSWEQLTSGTVRYRVIQGDSTSPSPNVTAVATVATGLSDRVSYGSIADKFLVVYAREAGGTLKSNVHGRFISSNGLSLGAEFTIAGGTENQQKPRIGYAPSTNRWMVVWEDWSNCGAGCPQVRGALVSATGAVVKTFLVAASAGWDVPGPVGYNPANDTFVTGWRSSLSDTNNQARAGEFSPADGKPVRAPILLSDLNPGVEALAIRPDQENPQALFLWRRGYGLDGVHAGIVRFNAPEPDSTPPAKVIDLEGKAASAGTLAPATPIASTNPGPSEQDMTKTTDGDPATYWSSPDRNAITPEFITWDLGAPKDLSRVRLLSRNAGGLFPVDYQIQVSPDNVSFQTVYSVTGASVGAGRWVDHVLPGPRARYVKLAITRTRLSATGTYKAQVAEVEIADASNGAAVEIEWTAPGDDGNNGTATAYDLRWSSNPITASNFGAATSIAAPAPSPAGTRQSVTVGGFARESLIYFALKAKDELANVSELSNVISVATEGMAPAAVQGFAASNPTGTTIDLSWLPSGDDGNAGNATSYDLRYSTSPITDANFGAATSVIRPATNPKPVLERYRLGGLASQTTYYLAIKALDDVGNASLMNGGGPVTATTADAAAPSAILDLAVSGRTATKLSAVAVASSGQSSATTGKEKATDGNPSSYWSSPGRTAPQAEFITVDLRSLRSIGRVTLLSRGGGPLFPQDLSIQVSVDNQTFVTVASRSDIPSTTGTLHEFEFPPVSARYVRIHVTKTRVSAGGLYYAQIAEIEVWQAITSYLLTLTWTEPGDDGATGTAASYDVRYSRSPIGTEAAFLGAAMLGGLPAPRVAGSVASFSFDPPEEGVILYFRMRAFDDAGNPSALSNQASALVAVVPPAAITNLTAFDAASTSIDLSWTSTGDDGASGTATSFDVRYSTSPVTEGNFPSATEVLGEPAPAPGGTQQQMTVTGLTPSTTYYFAMKVEDESGATSLLSNLVSATTDAPDTIPPAAVSDLAGSPPFTVDRLAAARAIGASSVASSTTAFANATDSNLSSYWGSNGTSSPAIQWITVDAGASHDIGQVRIRSRSSGPLFPEDLEIQVSVDNVTFSTVHTASGLPSTAGMWHTFDFPAASARYVRVRATKLRASADGLYYSQISEIELYEASLVTGPVKLRWTAPGDDGVVGKAASYDLRYSVTPIVDLAGFDAASEVEGEPAPQGFGSLESFEVNLPPGAYYFAIRTRDEAGNESGLSNVPMIVVP